MWLSRDLCTHSIFMDEECCHGHVIPSHSVHQWSDTTAVCSVRIIAASAKGNDSKSAVVTDSCTTFAIYGRKICGFKRLQFEVPSSKSFDRIEVNLDASWSERLLFTSLS